MDPMDDIVPLWLRDKTFCVEYSPNCKSKWMVRLCGKGRAFIDKLPASKTGDAIGYGNTLAFAAEGARDMRLNQEGAA